MELHEFVIGNWYLSDSNQILKYAGPYDNKRFGTHEWFTPSRSYNTSKSLLHTSNKILREVSIAEIMNFLPDGHPDLYHDQLLTKIL